MAFHFTLQALLRIRVSYEHLERLRLLALTALANRIRQELATVRADSLEAHRSIRELLAGGVSGGELHFAVANERSRASRRLALAVNLAQAETRRDKQRKVFEEARQKRRILENLRERRLEEYHRDQLRRQQKQVDELHLIHRLTNSLERSGE